MYLNKVKIKTIKKKENISLINDLYLLVCVSYFFLFLLKYEVLWIIYLKLDFKIAVKISRQIGKWETRAELIMVV